MSTIYIYSKDNCPQCTEAISLCTNKLGVVPTVYKLDIDYTREGLFEKIGHPVRTVPQVFEEHEHIGGIAEFKVWLSKKLA